MTALRSPSLTPTARRIWPVAVAATLALVSPALAQDTQETPPPAQETPPETTAADQTPPAAETLPTDTVGDAGDVSVVDPAAGTTSTADEGIDAVEFESIEEEFRTAEFTGNLTSGGAIASANARWIAHVYDDVLLRPADPGGLDHWLARIAAGGDRSRANVARLFLNSEEGSRGEATRAYAEILGRLPDPAGLAYWTDYLRSESVHSLRFLHLGSEEYYLQQGATNEAFVESLYEDLLLRSSDPGGFAYFVDLVDRGVPRQNIAGAIYMSAESVNNRVRAYFAEIVGRAPTTAELDHGANLIRSDDERAVRAWLLASDEAFETFVIEAFSG
jgi:hypothetical protein